MRKHFKLTNLEKMLKLCSKSPRPQKPNLQQNFKMFQIKAFKVKNKEKIKL